MSEPSAGRTAEQTGRLLAPAVHLLGALARRGSGWLAHEPRLERKIALADHLADDARAAHALAARVQALAPDLPGAPAGATAALLERLDACGGANAHLEVGYGDIKPAILTAAETYLEAADPLLERPTVAVVLELRADQERHLDELPPRAEAVDAGADAGVLGAEPGEAHEPATVPEPPAPVRDAYLELAGERPPLDDVVDALHALLHACVAAGERSARQYHDAGHPALARRASVHLRHAAVIERLLAAHDGRWGQRPVGPPHEDPYVLAEAIGLQHPSTARVLGHVLADRG